MTEEKSSAHKALSVQWFLAEYKNGQLQHPPHSPELETLEVSLIKKMEESQNQHDILLQGEDNQIKGLKDKIQIMWKTIEDLKFKVTEEKKLLKKEKSENERMMEEQVKLRKQLSMFHLPHCPAYNTPPCPVHTPSVHFNPQTFVTAPESQSDTSTVDLKAGFIGNHATGDNAEKQSFEELLRSLDPQPEGSLENLFEECRQPRAPTDAQDRTSSFTLLMSEQWQSRMAASNSRTNENIHQSCMFDQVETTPFNFELGEPQLSNPAHIYPNL